MAGARRVLAFLALFSGIALLFNILLSVDLRIGMAVMSLVLVAGAVFTFRRAGPNRRRLARIAGYGIIAGVLATLAYDVARTILSMIDGSPYKPFEAIVRFGQLLLGSQARDAGVVFAGAMFHTINGAAFGAAFTLGVVRNGRIGIPRVFLLGMGWGMFLEAFQFTLYPNWLGIRYFSEFVTISTLGHLAYGATLGPVARTFIRRSWRDGDD